MTCFDSLYAWRLDPAEPLGKSPLIFSAKKAQSIGCDMESRMTIPCGRCVGCLRDKSRIWSIRLFHEMQMHDRCCFMTLTYADNSQLLLNKDHLVNFHKRIRRDDYKFRYFSVGEYGDLTGRPHYHSIVFGEDFLGGSYKINDREYGNKIVEHHWGHGTVQMGSVTMESIMYVAGYVQKKLVRDTGYLEKDIFKEGDLCLMSRKPGIGKSWLDKYRQELLNNGFVVINGVKLDIPKAYLDWYVSEFKEVKEKRKDNVKLYTSDQLHAKKLNTIGKSIFRREVL